MYSKDDYLNSPAPYEELYQHIGDPFTHERQMTIMAEQAAEVGVRNFKRLYGEYVKSLKQQNQMKMIGNMTRFDGQTLELDAGEWDCDDQGIITRSGPFEVCACVHPIMPIERLVNIDTGVEKLKIAFRKGRTWRTIIADKRTLASAQAIINLADMGIAVNSENAKYLVKYLHDIENLNYDLIPEYNSVSRLGWIDSAGFSPYVEKLVFDGEATFKTYFEAVSAKGSRDEWMKIAKGVRSGGITGRLVLASAFASTLVKPFGALPFFVHLWGGTEVGKTVGLMLAASVWANPEVGRYIHTFNSTAVGREKSAGFVNSMPLILDELQVAHGDKQTRFDKDIYALSEGVGRTRGTRTGGVERTTTWANCIITNGEDPITSSLSGGGAVNRILEIECQDRLFDDARHIADTVRKNYGFAGKEFVEKLQEDGQIDRAIALYKSLYTIISDMDTTEKQSMAASIVLTADVLVTEWIFQDGRALAPEDIKDYLRTKDSVSVNERGYEFARQWVVQNAHRLCGTSTEQEVWGKIEGSTAYVIRSKFNQAVNDAGYNPQALLSWMKQRDLIETRGRATTKNKRINNIATECVAIKMAGEESEDGQIQLPFDADF